MVERSTPIHPLQGAAPRSPRPGRPDGSSEQGVFVARWTDEDSGAHTATLRGASEQAIRDQLEPLVASNSLTIRRVS